MQELLKSIGLSLENEILKEAKQSTHYGIIFYEIYVHTQAAGPMLRCRWHMQQR